MDISQVRYEPWRVVRQLGKGAYGSVFEIEREEFGERYTAALKVISIPQNNEEIIANRADGMTDKSMASYYHSVVKELTHELALLSKLKGNTNIVGYEDHKIVQHPDQIGWDIYIRMELLTSLTALSAKYDFSRNQVVKVGIDICNALMLCEKNNILHRDIKPDNIFVSDHGDYKLGDFGIARTASQSAANMSTKGTPNYMAPEVYKGMSYDATVDIYSLGIVLYQMMNGKRLPFIPVEVTLADREAALGRRMSGERFPEPEMADEEFARVILKACAYAPGERYQNAFQMKKDLEKLIEGVYVAPIDVRAILGAGAYVGAQGGYTVPGNNSGGYAQAGNNSGGYAQAGNNSGGYSRQGGSMSQDSFVQTGSYIRQGGSPGSPGYVQQQGGYTQGQNVGGSAPYNRNYVQGSFGQNAGKEMNTGGFDATAGYTQQGGNQDPNNRSYVPSGNVPSVAENQPNPAPFDLTTKSGTENAQYTGGGISRNDGTPPVGKKLNIKLICGIAAAAVAVIGLVVFLRGGKTQTVTTNPASESVTAGTESKTESKPAESAPAKTESKPAESVPVKTESNSGSANPGPAALSESLDDYIFELDGVVMQLPVSYEEFTSHGWSLYSYDNSKTEEDIIRAQDYNFYDLTNGDARIDVYIYNPSGDSKPLKECKIGAVQVSKDEGISFKVADGVELGISAEDVLAKFGTPSRNETKSDSQRIVYKSGDYSEDGQTEFYYETGHSASNYISIQYMPEEAIDASGVSSERPAYLDTYVAPTALPNDPTQTVFQLGDDLYQLPCTIEAFLDTGWTITSKNVDVIASGQYELSAMGLSRDGYTIDLSLINFDEKAAKAENCAVGEVTIYTFFEDDDMPGDYAVFSGGLKLGSSVDEYTEALGSFRKDEYSTSTDFSYYDSDYTKSVYYSISTGSYRSAHAMIENRNWNY